MKTPTRFSKIIYKGDPMFVMGNRGRRKAFLAFMEKAGLQGKPVSVFRRGIIPDYYGRKNIKFVVWFRAWALPNKVLKGHYDLYYPTQSRPGRFTRWGAPEPVGWRVRLDLGEDVPADGLEGSGAVDVP